MTKTSSIISLDHLRRRAGLYVRQSSGIQVKENTGSTAWQLSLKQDLISQGWPEECIEIFADLGVSGKGGIVRDGFTEMLENIRLRKLGIVMVVDETRIARNDEHWGRLMEVMAVTDTLFYCHDQILNLNNSMDREMATYMQAEAVADSQDMREKFIEGRLALAQQGLYKMPLPTGYERQDRKIIKTVDQDVQDSLNLVFQKFEEIETAAGVTLYFNSQQLLVPRKKLGERTQLTWEPATRSAIEGFLTNPLYSGTYVFGKYKSISNYDENFHLVKNLQYSSNPMNWDVKIRDSFEGYITWDRYLQNRQILTSNLQGKGERSTVPREGGAILQGLLQCATCGQPLLVSYSPEGAIYYYCARSRKKSEIKACKIARGDWLDKKVSEIITDILNDEEISLAIQEKLSKETKESKTADLHHMDILVKTLADKVSTAKSSILKALYQNLDPEIIQSLQSIWKTLRTEHETAKENYERRMYSEKEGTTTPADLSILANLSQLFSKFENSDSTTNILRKKIIRCFIQWIEVVRNDQYYIVIHWHSETYSVFHIPPRPRKSRKCTDVQGGPQ